MEVSFDWNGVDKDAEEPVERKEGRIHAVGREVPVEPGQLFRQQFLQHFLLKKQKQNTQVVSFKVRTEDPENMDAFEQTSVFGPWQGLTKHLTLRII